MTKGLEVQILFRSSPLSCRWAKHLTLKGSMRISDDVVGVAPAGPRTLWTTRPNMEYSHVKTGVEQEHQKALKQSFAFQWVTSS